MSKISFFPMINNKLLVKSKYKNDNFEFYFHSEDRRTLLPINVDNINPKIILKDKNNRWEKNYHDLVVKQRVRFNPKCFFGKEGIAPTGSTLGFAIGFNSQSSLQKDYKKAFIFDENTNDIDLSIEYKFDKQQLRGEATLNTFIYLEKSTLNVIDEESHLNNEVGVFLGEIVKSTIILDGEGSSFPTELSDNHEDPLWKLHVSLHDELNSMVNESITLILNENHKDYDILDINNKLKYNEEFIKEMMINIIFQLMLETKDYYEDLEVNRFTEGSVGHLLSYYKETFDLDLDSPIELYSKISKGVRG